MSVPNRSAPQAESLAKGDEVMDGTPKVVGKMGLLDLFRRRALSKSDLPIWTERPPTREVDAIYQTAESSSHTYYVATKRPRGLIRWMSLGEEFKLSGLSHNKNFAECLLYFFRGDKRWIVFEQDTGNIHDQYAVRAIGIWTDRKSSSIRSGAIGWVSRDANRLIVDQLKKGVVVGTPKVFFIGEQSPGLRFRAWVDWDAASDAAQFQSLREFMIRNGDTTIAEASEYTGIQKSRLRNALEKLASDEIVAATVMEAFSGYRVSKSTHGRTVRYALSEDTTRTYKRSSGMTEQQIADDPMGAEVPEYVLKFYTSGRIEI
jgi:hypothetical protein